MSKYPYPGYLTPREMFMWWDWEDHPSGPPLDDPRVSWATEAQWRAFVEYAKRERERRE